MTIKSYKDLEVWQKAMDLVVMCYEQPEISPNLKFMVLQANYNVQLYQSRPI